MPTPLSIDPKWVPSYSKWRHGGWYVDNLQYPSGACGCVSNNYPDKKWRIACDDRRTELGQPGDFTFLTRDAAAIAEYTLVQALREQQDGLKQQNAEPIDRPRG